MQHSIGAEAVAEILRGAASKKSRKTKTVGNTFLQY